MEENNYYEDKQNRQFLDNLNKKEKFKNKTAPVKREKDETQAEKLSNAAKEVGTDVAAGVLAGGLGAALFGSYSVFAGLLVSGFGHYTKNKYVARLGLGMMASSSMKATQGVKQDPKAGMLDNIQERVKAFGQELQRKLLLDKLLSGKKKDDTQPKSILSGLEENEKAPQHIFEAKAKLQQNTKPETIEQSPIASQEIAEREQPITKANYKINNEDPSDDDLSDITDHLY